jgi:hypothetical protein
VERRCQNSSNGNAVNTSNAHVMRQSEFRIVDYD